VRPTQTTRESSAHPLAYGRELTENVLAHGEQDRF
jgi:hypothetical protein